MKNNNGLIIVTVILSVLVIILGVLLGGYIVNNSLNKSQINSSNNTENSDNNTNEHIDKNVEGNKFKPWMNYVLEQNITKIELVDYVCDSSDKKTIEITSEQLKNIFNKFMNYKLRLSYISGSGWTCGNTLNIEYLKDGKEFELMFVPNYFIPSSSNNSKILDKDLEIALSNSVDVIENEDEKGQEGVYSHYDLVTNEDILNEYFK